MSNGVAGKSQAGRMSILTSGRFWLAGPGSFVLAHEIESWSVGRVVPGNPLAADVDAIVAVHSNDIDAQFHEEIGIGSSPAGNLSLFFHTHRKNGQGQIEDYGVELEVDAASGAVLSRRQGAGAELRRSEEASALGRFLVDIHTELHLPRPWGLLLTGILSLAMIVAATSGVLMHRHLFADIFVLRKKRSQMVQRRDLHTVVGTWGIPFAFLLAFTGSFFSFVGSFGLPAMAMVAFGGDQEAMMRTIIGAPDSKSEVPAPVANLNQIVADGQRLSGLRFRVPLGS